MGEQDDTLAVLDWMPDEGDELMKSWKGWAIVLENILASPGWLASAEEEDILQLSGWFASAEEGILHLPRCLTCADGDSLYFSGWLVVTEE